MTRRMLKTIPLITLTATMVLLVDRASYGQYNTVNEPTKNQVFTPHEAIFVSGNVNFGGAPTATYVTVQLYDSNNMPKGDLTIQLNSEDGSYDSDLADNGAVLYSYDVGAGQTDNGFVVVKAFDSTNTYMVGATRQVLIEVTGE